MKGYPHLRGKCRYCGEPTLRGDGEIIDTLITLEKHAGITSSEYLGEWCSEDCFYKDFTPKDKGV